ncbi:hypothetical protein HXZ94_16010 [Empedobacter falsenii]|uniref:hypothetical protein n=1 Tax=Empedobacter falsenii TaxID=343874 RepID=UPI002576F4ED|nr:hypothetical protein [Empedobacter falsenii]MDM1300001.1 hypothetical protein [Empedobacter falsenii]MDM1319788.1 hypothetical protein [Empedobacter falsenii]
MVAVSEYDIRDVLDLEEGKDFSIVEDVNQKSATFTFNKLNFYYDKKLGGTDAEKHKEEENIVDYLWIFNYFWLPENLAQTYFVPISTCRYPNQIAKIKIYPDLEWEIKLDFGATVPESKSHRNMPPEHGIFEKHQKEAKEAGDNRRWLNSEVSFTLAIKAKSGDFEREISTSYEQKIRSFLQTLVTIKDFLDTISGSTEAKKSKGNLAKEALSKIPDKFKLPISFEIEYPTINITGSWKNELYADQPKVGKTGSLSFGFTPLIKGQGTLDLLACLDYLPVVGPIFKVAALIRDAINNYTPLTAEIYLNIYAFGHIDLKANIIIGNEESGGELECDTTVGLGLEMGVTAGAEVPKLSFGASEVDDPKKKEESGFGFGAEASAKGETSLIFKGKRGISNKGIYIELGVDFGGMQAYVTAKVDAKTPLGKTKLGVSDKPYTVLDPKPDILKGKYYIIENNQ